ncbi:MAG: guanosine pentaphosphatase [Psychromonas sp.]|nr:guanosine pentaphosphatase [Psychromonas sp.]
MNKNHYTIIDLGSNSFHMLTVTRVDNGFSVHSKSKQKVRLASGLDAQHNLNPAIMEQGWACLQQFSEELTQLQPCKIMVTATAALRLAKNKLDFINKAQTILGQPIKLISGIEEAKTIYRGVAFTEQISEQLLVIDIGGASTELIIGKGKDILLAKSLDMGCVTWLNRYFADQKLNNDNFRAAINGAKDEIKPQIQNYTNLSWTVAMGASGTIQAIQEINKKQQISKELTLPLLNTLKQLCISCGTINSLKIDGLKSSRIPVFASGLAILIALFESLNIKSIKPSKGALREGLISILFEDSE